MDTADTPPPGSPEALGLGCLCPVYDNCHGRGVAPGIFVYREDCPVHGPALKEKLSEVSYNCPHCGSDKDTWFSRTEPMGDHCPDCGKMVD
jgi:predicted RNA-binding Zn-ribbon protein involved in translation (DUF1610 family)